MVRKKKGARAQTGLMPLKAKGEMWDGGISTGCRTVNPTPEWLSHLDLVEQGRDYVLFFIALSYHLT
jgi:hypothetical protein